MSKRYTLGHEPVEPGTFDRRDFLKLGAVASAAVAVSRLGAQETKPAPATPPPPVTTNIADALKVPRTASSMPGLYPGKVVKMHAPCLSEKDGEAVYRTLCDGLMALTGEKKAKKAWQRFVTPKDIVGLKVNPISPLVANNPLLVQAVVRGLKEAGLPAERIVIWDRRPEQMKAVGITKEAFPGVCIEGTELVGPNGDYYDANGRLWSEDWIDREALAYECSLTMKHDKELMAAMVNEGTTSYFTRLVTRRCTKLINLPTLKNAGANVTTCMKNLTYGSLSNTARLHKIWSRSIAEGCAFPALRDKLVLNIVDGTQACYDGGPAPTAATVYRPNLLLLGTDPVAVDTICYEYMIAERIARGVQKADNPRSREFLNLAAGFGLGITDRAKIQLTDLKA